MQVTNNSALLEYQLGYISFARPGHFLGLIPTPHGWILYDGISQSSLLPLREAIQKLAEENALINVIYYYISKCPKPKSNRGRKGKTTQDEEELN